MSLRKKVILVEGIEFLILALCLFIAAGTVAWPAAWIFLGLLLVSSLLITWWLLKYDPELIEERLRFRPELSWDKVFVVVALAFIIFWLILIPLDAVRFHWSQMPSVLKTIGALVLLISLTGASHLIVHLISHPAGKPVFIRCSACSEGTGAHRGFNRALQLCATSHVHRSHSLLSRSLLVTRLLVWCALRSGFLPSVCHKGRS